MMLIVVIAVFLSVETPLMVITALHTISSRWGKIIRLGGENKLATAVYFQRYGLSWLWPREKACVHYQPLYLPLLSSKLCHLLRHVKVSKKHWYFLWNFYNQTLSSRQFRDTFRLIIVTPVVKKFSSNIKMDQQTNENEDSSTKLTKSRR